MPRGWREGDETMSETVLDLSQGALDKLVARIVDTVHPKRIILFGSAARGEMDASSDIDVLVVMPEGINRLHTAQDIYMNLGSF